MGYSYSKPKMKPCLDGGKHSWRFASNYVSKTTTVSRSGTTVRLTTKGLYSCSCCDAKKSGRADNTADLRQLLSIEQPSN